MTKHIAELATPTGANEFSANLIFDPHIKRTLASVFHPGPFPPGVNAMMEFFDNAVAFRRKDLTGHIPATFITATIADESLSIRDQGEGADQNGIAGFLIAGGSAMQKGISALGAGGKSAVFFFGDNLMLRAKKRGKKSEFSCDIPDFGNPDVAYEGKVKIQRHRTRVPTDEGFFEVTISKLRQTIKPAKLIEAASQIYRPLLIAADGDTGRTIVDRDGIVMKVFDKIVMNVAGQGNNTQVEPQVIPLAEGNENDIEITRTEKGEPVWFWCGQKDEKAEAASDVEPGLRYYFDGRLIASDFLGCSSKDPRLRNLVGEVHLDHIEDIKDLFSLNKTGGINKTSSTWQRIAATLRDSSLGAYVDTLLHKPIDIVLDKPEYFDKSALDVRDLLRESIGALPANGIMTGPILARLRELMDHNPVTEKRGRIYTGHSHTGNGKRDGSITIHREHPGHVERKGKGFIKKVEIEKGDGVLPYRFIDGIMYLDMNNALVQIRMGDQANTMVMIGEYMAEILSDLVCEEGNKEKIKSGIVKALGKNIRNHPVYQRHFHITA